MDPLTMGLISAGIGLGKGVLVDEPAAKRDNLYRAELMRYSPWTRIPVDPSNTHAKPLDQALQGFGGGFAQGQKMEEHEDRKAAMDQLSPYERAALLLRSPAASQGSGVTVNAFGSGSPAGATQAPWRLMDTNLGTFGGW